MFSKRRTTTFVNDDDSIRLKKLQEKFEVEQAKKLKKQLSAGDLIKEREDKIIKGVILHAQWKSFFCLRKLDFDLLVVVWYNTSWTQWLYS